MHLSRVVKVIIAVAALLIAARAALPYVVESFAERKLNELDGYRASVRDVDLAIWRGAYTVQGVSIDRHDATDTTPFVYWEALEVSVDWQRLFDGVLHAEIDVVKPVINFVVSSDPTESQSGGVDEAESPDWVARITELSPIEVERLTVTEGYVQLLDKTKDPVVDVFIDDLSVELENVSNRRSEIPTTAKVSASSIGNAQIEVAASLLPLAESIELDVDARVTDLDLVALNDFFRAYGDFDLEKGTGSVFTEVAVRDGRVDGYVKPMLRELDVLRWGAEEDSDGIGQKLFEGIVGATAEILENQSKDTFGARVPITGRLTDPGTDPWMLLVSILRNAFVKALLPRVDETVDRWPIHGVELD